MFFFVIYFILVVLAIFYFSVGQIKFGFVLLLVPSSKLMTVLNIVLTLPSVVYLKDPLIGPVFQNNLPDYLMESSNACSWYESWSSLSCSYLRLSTQAVGLAAFSLLFGFVHSLRIFSLPALLSLVLIFAAILERCKWRWVRHITVFVDTAVFVSVVWSFCEWISMSRSTSTGPFFSSTHLIFSTHVFVLLTLVAYTASLWMYVVWFTLVFFYYLSFITFCLEWILSFFCPLSFIEWWFWKSPSIVE